MDKRVILAVAGSGKTYHICNSLNPEKKNLILAFTHENIHNIVSELVKAYGKVPELTTVMTFDAFKYRFLLKPYEFSILSSYSPSIPSIKGITTINSPKNSIVKNGKSIHNPLYINKEKIGHYITQQGYCYCDRVSELLLNSKIGNEKLLDHVSKNLNYFFDYIYIDEFQDYREYDYDLLMNIVKNCNNILLVGDYYQHSVSGTNNSGKPFSKRKSIVPYSDFLNLLQDNKLIVDTDSLNVSRRCSLKICNFVRERLKIDIYGNDQKSGDIIIINDMELAQRVIKNNNITKLVYNKADKMPFNAVNWSYSKGDTLNGSCVMLTNATDIILDISKSCKEISPITLNKLYVALTRSSGDTYLISSSLSKKIICDISKK